MKRYLVKTPKLVQRIFPKRVWAFPNTKNNVYLTFDDGPIAEVTPWVLNELKKYNAKATFFCIGDNIKKHPDTFEQVVTEGHSIGNHTFHHVKGAKTNTKDYVKDVSLFEDEIADRLSKTSNTKSPVTQLFRPPYGSLKKTQAKALQKLGYTIVMWDVLSADFDADISEEKCLQNVIKNIEAGSIVVFHDSLKAEAKLKYALPKVLAYVQKRGWTCTCIVPH